MKVRVIKTPSFAGGGIYDTYRLSPGEILAAGTGLGKAAAGIYGLANEHNLPSISGNTFINTMNGVNNGINNFGKMLQNNGFGANDQKGNNNTQKLFHDQIAKNQQLGLTPINNSTTFGRPKSSNESERSQSLINGKRLPVQTLNGPMNLATSSFQIGGGIFYNQSMQQFENGGMSRRRPLARTFRRNEGFYQEGGYSQPQSEQIDPQTAAMIKNIVVAIQQGNDPNDIVDLLEQQSGSKEQATALVQYALQVMNPTSEQQMPQYGMAAFGGDLEQMNGSEEFQAPTGRPYVIDTPLMKDGGHTFLTSQPAYTKRSVNYFGTSNAPARDSYTDNDEITTSVKAVPREDATIEAEKGEYILSKQGLYKIEGKKHSKGGTPLAAKGGEFIYSDHKDMYIDPELQTKANLKKPSSSKFKENTPAKVLERNVDTKEYNRLKAIVGNPKHDAITKKTAQFMLEKMDNKLKVIAKLQEANKQSDPVEFKDQYLEQPEVQNDVNEQKQFAYGGMPMYEEGTPIKGTMFSGAQSDVNSDQSKQQAAAYDKALRDAGYNGPSIIGLDYNKTHPEIKQAQEFAAGKFGPDIASYLRTQKPSNAVQAILKGRDMKDVSDQELLKAYPDSYWSWRGYVPTANKPAPYSSGQQIGIPDKEQDKDLDLNIPHISSSNYVGSDYDIKNPYAKVRAMQASQYLSNVAANKPYFTYVPRNVQPNTRANVMSEQPFLDEAAKARYSANQLASKFGDSSQRMIAAAQQNDAVNKGLFEVGKYNTESYTNNYNQNLLRNAATANQFNQQMKQVYDQNANVLDKMNFANAKYYSDYSTARQKDLLDQYYAAKDLQTQYIPYMSTYETTDPLTGKKVQRLAAPTDQYGRINPNWNGWNTSATASAQKSLNTDLEDEIKNDKTLTASERYGLLLKMKGYK